MTQRKQPPPARLTTGENNTSVGKARGHFKMAGFAAVFSAFLFLVMFGFSSSDPMSRFSGPSIIEKGVVASSGSSYKPDPSILSYRVKVPSYYAGYTAQRIIHARKNACNKEKLTIGEVVWLTSHQKDRTKFARLAVTTQGCVLQNEKLLADMMKANNRDGAVAVIWSGIVTLYFIIAGSAEWFRQRRKGKIG